MLSDVVGQGGKLPIGFEYIGLGIDMAKGDLNNSTDKNHFWLTLNISKVLIFFLSFFFYFILSHSFVNLVTRSNALPETCAVLWLAGGMRVGWSPGARTVTQVP